MDNTLEATVGSQLRALESQIVRAYEKGTRCHWRIGETLNNIRRSVIDASPEAEREKLEQFVPPIDFKIPERESEGLYTVHGQEAYRLYSQLATLIFHDQVDSSALREQEKTQRAESRRQPLIFIGHGRSRLWARVKLYLDNELKVATVSYESESRVGESIVPVLGGFLDQATFAVLILTGEDDTADGQLRARQNVIHEAGLFQGRLGFKKAVLLVQDNVEEFSNVAGLQHIPFSGQAIEQTFYELQRVLKREGIVR
jgi:predicted nucleotide-binding protein